MANCKQCGKEYESKRSTSSYCSSKCRHEFYRNRMSNAKPISNANAKNVTLSNNAKISGTCWCCGKSIEPILVCCQECAWSGEAAVKRAGAYPPLLTDLTPGQMETDLHTLKLSSDYKMTDFEREHYRSANQLQGQYNPVSKPGDDDYVPQYETTRRFINDQAQT